MNSITELDSWVREAGSVGIAGHVRPDGDCVGASLAVYNYIKDNYPEVRVEVFLEKTPNIFNFLRGVDMICNDYPDREPFGLFIALDCGDIARLGKAAKYMETAGHSLCIDHHESNSDFAEGSYIFPKASSTCELIYELIGKDRVTREIAECLYTGMVHDTGVFQYSCTSSKTMRIAGELMDRGIDYPWIVEHTFFEKTFEQNRVLGHALDKSYLCLDGQCIVSWLTAEEMKEYQVLPKHMEGIVSQLRSTKGVRVAVFSYQNEDGSYKFSLRASDDTNLAQLAMEFGGGGHAKAAGLTMYGTPEENIPQVIAALEKRFREQG